MNGTEMYHGLMRNHELTLEFGLYLHQLSIVADPLIIKLDVRNGQHVVGRMMDTESHEITYHDHDEIEYDNETYDERQELCETHELPVCNIRIFEMIKYSFGQDEEYVAVKEDEYDDLGRTNNDACRAYQEIFRMMDEGWMVTRA
nr:hypothetical protein [Tanacetum cinerariifolium]